MIIGMGVDIVDIGRIDALRKRYGMRFLSRVFTPEEIAYCTARHDMAASLAGRFAAKEATFKALSSDRASGIGFREIGVASHGSLPRLSLTGKARERAEELGMDRCHLSISHDRGCALAVVILEGS
ncbi:MAG TPA: holo-ACP synthase [Deltaproteobacteria bacterium]|nr:holo-ACP synthase [Deltaproteobacteria bacterium]HQI79942.1 holo-ACP synthase [Deltaproteobacteria bacterium]